MKGWKLDFCNEAKLLIPEQHNAEGKIVFNF